MFRVDVHVPDPDKAEVLADFLADFVDSGDEQVRRVADAHERLKWSEELCGGREGGSDERPVWLLVGFAGAALKFSVDEWPDYALDPHEPEPPD
jgi:hypothetical protein